MATFEDIDAGSWYARGTDLAVGPGVSAALDVLATDLPGTSGADLVSAYAPLARVVGDRREARGDGAAGPFLVGVAGGVASGKTTTSRALAALLPAGDGATVEVVSTDGFLLSNVDLEAARLTTRKGFPESYDEAALLAFVDAARAGAFPLEVPVYDHTTYDVMAQRRVVEHADVVVVEGVNALQSLPRSGSSLVDRLDFGVYVDAREPDLRRWFVDRMVRFRAAAAEDGRSSFYDVFAALSDEGFLAMADTVWTQINLPNLVDHIEPTRERADIVLEKAADHSVRGVRFRRD
jgi:type I pantothenate kinase